MSREIKFRCWNSVDKRFVPAEVEVTSWIHLTINDHEEYTFQQYTGLKDQFGKEIYEGDIISCQTLDDQKFSGRVFYSGESSCYGVYNDDMNDGYKLFCVKKITVISNVFSANEF